MICFAPFLLPLALVLRCTGEGKIFYRQQRVGRGGKNFGLVKFATMLENSPNMAGGDITAGNDPRVLPLGHFLRKTKINELPQLLNILNGDRSVIGPRPQTQRCFDAFPAEAQETIVKVRPGLSGIGSIVFRDEEEIMHAHNDPTHFYDHLIMPYKGELEEWYVANQDLWIYIMLIILTVWVVLFPRSGVVGNVFGALPRPNSLLAKVLLP